MKLLAFELSTRRAGIALTHDGRLLAEEAWEERHQKLFEVLPRLLQRNGMTVNEVDVFAVGRGPGAFSGIRVAVTAAQTFALPAGKKVITVSSGEALAFSVLRETSAARVAVVGDARRGTLWYGVFDRTGQTTPWSLTTPAQLPDAVPSDAILVSPDWDRIVPLIKEKARWVAEAQYPSARAVAEVAWQRLKDGKPSDPLEPLYMHPPV